MSTSYSSDSPTEHNQNQLLASKGRGVEAAQRMAELFSQEMKLQDLLEQALHIALEAADAENGSILLADPDTRALIFHHSIGDNPAAPGIAVPWHESIAGTVYTTGTPDIVSDAQADMRHFKNVDRASGSITRDMITVPLKSWDGAPIGVIQVMNKRGNACLDHDDLAVLTVISTLTAVALEHMSLN